MIKCLCLSIYKTPSILVYFRQYINFHIICHFTEVQKLLIENIITLHLLDQSSLIGHINCHISLIDFILKFKPFFMLRGQHQLYLFNTVLHDSSLFLSQTNFITIICSVKDKCNTSLCVRFILNLRVVCLLFNCMNDLASNQNCFLGGWAWW